jgi:hypothetical protein
VAREQGRLTSAYRGCLEHETFVAKLVKEGTAWFKWREFIVECRHTCQMTHSCLTTYT